MNGTYYQNPTFPTNQNNYDVNMNSIPNNQGLPNNNNDGVESNITEDDIYRFICIKIFATTEQIATHFKTNIEHIAPLLEELYFVQRRIRTYSLEDDPRHNIAKCSWTRR